MAGGQPGANSRGRGGKFRKFTRGGGKHFSRDLRPVDADGNEISMWSADAHANAGSSDEDQDSDEEDSSEDQDSDDAGPSTDSAAQALSREERKKEKKARKDAAAARARGQAVQAGDLPPSDSDESDDADMPANPNHSRAARNQTKIADKVDDAADGVKALSVGAPNRRERESIEAQLAKERYQKLHEQGKTDEAKADLARLQVIREKRAAEAARKSAEKEEKDARDQERKAELEAKEAKKRDAAMGPKTKGKKAK